MATAHNDVLDAGINYIATNTNNLVLCSQEPTTYAEATSTYILGTKTSVSIGSAEDGDTSGRKVVVAGFTDGSASATGSATHYALVDTDNSKVLITAALASSLSLTNGSPFALPAFDIEAADPT